ncbi:hypothetical protein LINPERHAP2_LOCUS10784 [Linum perenne]
MTTPRSWQVIQVKTQVVRGVSSTTSNLANKENIRQKVIKD